jgi:hypothetical protein
VTFAPGDHLRVYRRLGTYTHHAVMVHDGQVVEFGGSTKNKSAMSVVYAPFDEFAKTDRVQVVPHGRHNPELAVRRAEWLVECPPARRYNAIGFNCEHVARWCATGWETESLQIRHGLFLGRTVTIGVPLQVWLTWRAHTSRPVPRPWSAALWIYPVWVVWTVSRYHNEIRHFNEHIRKNCPAALRGV